MISDSGYGKGTTLATVPLLSLLREAETAIGRVEVIRVGVTAPAREYERSPPFWLDTDIASETTTHQTTQYFKQLKHPQSELLLTAFPGARITGQGALISNKGRIVRNSILEFLAHNKTPDGFERLGPDETFRVSTHKVRRINVPCILAKRPWYSNYGHWLVDSLSVLALNKATIQAKGLAIVLGAFPSAGMRALVFETIEKIFPGTSILEHPDDELWECDRVYYQMPPHVPPLFKSPDALKQIREMFLPQIVPAKKDRRIFISRRQVGTRRLVNEGEIYEICSRFGFELVEPEKLSFLEQVRIFSEASSVIGVKGAALTNCLFCFPKAKLIALSPADFPDPFFWDLVSQLEIEYGEIFGTITTNLPQGLNDFVITKEQILNALVSSGI